MKNSSSPVKKAFDYIDIVILFAILAYILRSSHIFAQLQTVGFDDNIIRILLLGLIPLRIFFFSGLFGNIIEVVSGEEMNITWKRLKANAKKFWLLYTVLITIPYLFHFILFAFYPKSNISLLTVNSFSAIIVLFLFASYSMKKKYPDIKSQKNTLIVTGSTASFLGLLYLCNIIIVNKLPTLEVFSINFNNISSFSFEFFQIFTYLLISLIYIENTPGIMKKSNNQKELILINPPCGNVIQPFIFPISSTYPPLFVILKALTPKEYKVREYDQKFWKKRYYTEGKLVAITCFSANSYEAYNIAKEFKKRGSKVILGGPHVTYLPKEAKNYCDSVVIGDAEGVWKDIVKDYENGNLKEFYSKESTDELHSEVHQKLLESDPKEIRGFLETTRGCKFRCNFCTIPGLAGGKVRRKRIEEIVALLKKVRPYYKRVNFLDNNIYNDPAYCKELFKAMKPVKILWTSHSTIDIAKNEEVLRLARESGCYEFKIGFEIFDDSEEQKQGGKFAMSKKYIDYTRRIQAEGIDVKATFILGWDTDYWRNFLKLWKFNFLLRPNYSSLGILTPFPGTKVYEEMLEENRMRNLNWREYDGLRVVFNIKHLNEFLLSKLFMPINIINFITTAKVGQLLGVLFIISVIAVIFKFSI